MPTKSDMLWLSVKKYNYISANFTAIYNPPAGINPPKYVTDFGFGIVGLEMRLDLHKVNRRGWCLFYYTTFENSNDMFCISYFFFGFPTFLA
jgi:hypothetical protein